jgi:hypothetical protein
MKNWTEICLCLSEARLNAYRQEVSDTPQQLLERYKANLDACQKLYPPLHILEIILRNKIHCSISELFNDREWIFSIIHRKKTAFSAAINKLDTHTMNFLLNQIEESYKTSLYITNSQKRPVLEDDLIANLNFGFWTFILSKKYSNILHDKGLFLKTFSAFQFNHRPPEKEYYAAESEIRAKIDKVRKIRNRVFHHEKIKNFEYTMHETWALIGYISTEIHDLFKP